MSWSVKCLLTLLVLPVLVPPAFAQQTSNALAKTRPVLVNVFDLHGNAIRDLKPENFQAQLNGKPTPIVGAQYTIAPQRIVVLLDVSGGMAGFGSSEKVKWQIAREAVQDLLCETTSDVPIAMLTFSDQVRDAFDFPNGRDSVAKWLREKATAKDTLRGRTALFDAINKALKILQPVRPGDSIYVISDGDDNASKSSAARAKTALAESGARLFAFLFPEEFPEDSQYGGREAFLQMALDSGGFVVGPSGRRVMEENVFLVPSPRSWASEYLFDQRQRDKVRVSTHDLCAQINGFWTLQLSVPSSHQTNKLKLEVIDSQGNKRKDVVFNYPRLLPASKELP